ncbi:hypothetical protein CRM22_001577 [Opisthorchis felineus]|uniref:Uncharacterized protein n=1 Tax=Opisthorchis felineus TaxID=147828 RepID=A0A4S2MGH3_OPIFE|nr:hypothetical protein CRM22_001577 [Opisthorchis felineus]
MRNASWGHCVRLIRAFNHSCRRRFTHRRYGISFYTLRAPNKLRPNRFERSGLANSSRRWKTQPSDARRLTKWHRSVLDSEIVKPGRMVKSAVYRRTIHLPRPDKITSDRGDQTNYSDVVSLPPSQTKKLSPSVTEKAGDEIESTPLA